ncbi:MAG: CapA family protein [Lachnospiraceae bacterium]|nr:CapA family protein [Lachnospiraceae bacterium]
MKKKQFRKVIITGYVLGSVLCFTGCGADVNAVIPKSGYVYDGLEEDFALAPGQSVEQDVNKLPEQEQKEPADSTPVQTMPESNKISITISAAGDCSLGNHIEQDYNSSFNQAYDTEGGAEYFLRNVKEIFAADDMTIVNLEGVLTTSNAAASGRAYNIKGDPSYAKILTEGSVEAVSMANNHRLDFGSEGTKDTEAALNAENIVYAYDKNVAIYETQGIQVGYVSVNEVAWGQGSEELVEEGINKLKEAGVDLILVACHWGVEKDNYPEAYQQRLGRKCIDMGADLVIGHHPHVLQGIEEYKGKLILHSLGNFCFGANRNPTDKDTMIFQQTFTFVDGELQGDMDALVIPCSISSVSSKNDFQPTPLAGEDATRVINRLNTYSADMGIVISEEGIVEMK